MANKFETLLFVLAGKHANLIVYTFPNLQLSHYINFSAFFKISVNTLLKIDLLKFGELRVRELESGNDAYMAGSKLRILAIIVEKDNKENGKYIPIPAKAGTVQVITTLNLLLRFLNSACLIFLTEHLGCSLSMDSMLPITDGSDVIAE